MSRQAVYACSTCTPPGSSLTAGICLACSLRCHEGHDLIELYTKRWVDVRGRWASIKIVPFFQLIVTFVATVGIQSFQEILVSCTWLVH